MVTVNETVIFAHSINTTSQVGVMTHFWSTAPPGVLDGVTVRYYVDGETTASVQFQPFFASGVGFADDTAPWGISQMGLGSGNGKSGPAIFNNHPVPFGKSIKVTVQHSSHDSGGFYIILRGMLKTQVSRDGCRPVNSGELRGGKATDLSAPR